LSGSARASDCEKEGEMKRQAAASAAARFLYMVFLYMAPDKKIGAAGQQRRAGILGDAAGRDFVRCVAALWRQSRAAAPGHAHNAGVQESAPTPCARQGAPRSTIAREDHFQ
jgi:hypothetical protein